MPALYPIVQAGADADSGQPSSFSGAEGTVHPGLRPRRM